MSERWIEKYNQLRSGSPRQDEKKDDFDLFYDLSEVDQVHVDTESAWKSLSEKISSKHSSLFTWWKVAASIVIILSAAFAIYKVQYIDNPDIQYVSERATNEQKIINLPDGSIITLAKNSSLGFPDDNFMSNRKVKFEGEGFFEITKGDNPFSVETSEAVIEVLGTSFGLSTRDNTSVVVEEGIVTLKTSKESMKVSEGKSALANKKDGKIKLIPTDPNALSWKTGKFVFSDARLSEVFDYLSKYYNVTFSADKSLEECRVTVRFNKESLDSVVDVLATILNAEAQISDKEVQFSGKGCN